MHSLIRTAFTSLAAPLSQRPAASTSTGPRSSSSAASPRRPRSRPRQRPRRHRPLPGTIHDLLQRSLHRSDARAEEPPAFDRKRGLDALAEACSASAPMRRHLVTAYSRSSADRLRRSRQTEKAAASSSRRPMTSCRGAGAAAGPGTTLPGHGAVGPQASESLSIAFGFIATEIQKGRIRKRASPCASRRDARRRPQGQGNTRSPRATCFAMYSSDFQFEVRKASSSTTAAPCATCSCIDLDPARDSLRRYARHAKGSEANGRAPQGTRQGQLRAHRREIHGPAPAARRPRRATQGAGSRPARGKMANILALVQESRLLRDACATPARSRQLQVTRFIERR